MPLGEEIPLERGHQKGYPLRNRYFTTIGSSSVKTVADRHRLAATHTWSEFSLKYAGDRPKQPAYEIKLMLSRVSCALAEISCLLRVLFWVCLLICA